jgi:hypothetical protein
MAVLYSLLLKLESLSLAISLWKEKEKAVRQMLRRNMEHQMQNPQEQ